MTFSINRAAVLGSGVMGAGIAAHLANVGIPTLLLDLVPKDLTEEEKARGLTFEDEEVRNRKVLENKQALLRQKPSPITTKKSLDLIEIGNLEDDLERLADVDWIIEVVVEDLTIKKEILATIDKHRSLGTIVSSNTSGISIQAMATDVSDDFQKHFLGTHFFNPPRYMKLLEIIPTEQTDPDVLSFMQKFGENILGKGVVIAKDTPNFIANRIGTYGLLVTVREMLKAKLSIGEVDSITGRLIGRPRSATFRTLDLVGLDTFALVANNVYKQVVDEEKEVFAIPEFMQKLIDEGAYGEKSSRGFYRRERGEDRSIIYELNYDTMQYEKRQFLRTPATEMAAQADGLSDKLKALFKSKGDLAADFIWNIMKPVFIYSAKLVGEIADHIVAIDEAMRWGFSWEMGPFEMWDAIGLEQSVQRMIDEGEMVPKWVIDLIESGGRSFYQTKDDQLHYIDGDKYEKVSMNEKAINLNRLKERQGVVKKNSGASLIDLGDGVLAVEFHSQNNAIGLDIIQMVNKSIEVVEAGDYTGLVIGNQGSNFCVGANLALMLMEAQDHNFFELDLVVKQFQDMTMNIKYCTKPVVAAPFNRTLGGGAEVSLPAAAIQASAETYIGLVEFGVGLIPGGGGTKELYLKQLRDLPEGIDFNLSKVANDVFEKIAKAKVSTSAAEAMEMGYLNKRDQISINPDHLLYDAKQTVLSLARKNYQGLKREKIRVVGDPGYAAMLLGAKTLKFGGYASAHDLKIAEKLAYVLSGGRIAEGTLIDEQVMLDLEREAFLSLIGEPLTQQRMQHMLLKGKPLRN